MVEVTPVSEKRMPIRIGSLSAMMSYVFLMLVCVPMYRQRDFAAQFSAN
jgi:hypothetical protein